MNENSQKMMQQLLDNAHKAMEEFQSYSQEEIDHILFELCAAFQANAVPMAKMAVEETGMGKYEDKVMKNSGAPAGAWMAVKGQKSVGVIGEDKARRLRFIAHPKGIVGNVAPTTNPNVTTIFVSIFSLKGRNACIISPHPSAKNATLYSVKILRDTLKKLNAPVDLIQGIEAPSKEMSQLLMASCDVTVATGGKAMVLAANSSGHPSFGVGPGNVQGILDPDFDNYAQFVAEGVVSREFDNGIVCADTQTFIIPENRCDEIVDLLKKEKAYVTFDKAEIDKFRLTMFPDGHMSSDLIGIPAVKVAEKAGIKIPADTRIIVLDMPADKAGNGDPLYGEKMCPVALLIKTKSYEESVEVAKKNLLQNGAGHSVSVHTNSAEKANYASMHLPVCRVLINQPAFVAANPGLTNGLSPTCSLGCGSWGNNSLSENLTFKHLMNIACITYPYPPEEIPDLQHVFDK